MATEKPIISGNLKIENIGNTTLMVAGVEMPPGHSASWTVFKGVDFKGDVCTGERAFDVSVVNPVPFPQE